MFEAGLERILCFVFLPLVAGTNLTSGLSVNVFPAVLYVYATLQFVVRSIHNLASCDVIYRCIAVVLCFYLCCFVSDNFDVKRCSANLIYSLNSYENLSIYFLLSVSPLKLNGTSMVSFGAMFTGVSF